MPSWKVVTQVTLKFEKFTGDLSNLRVMRVHLMLWAVLQLMHQAQSLS